MSALGRKQMFIEIQQHLLAKDHGTMSKCTPYPEINLSDVTVVAKQYQNSEKFKQRWLRVFIGIAATLSSLIIGGNLVSDEEFVWIALLTFGFGIPTVFFVIMYKCPHCYTTPAGVSYSLTSNTVSYTKGFHPLPKRCVCCGYYLSRKALESDLEKL